MSKGTFNQGWWNCFESFTSELLSVNKYDIGICIRVLSGAGITKKEAINWLNHYNGCDDAVIYVVNQYLNEL